MAAQRDIVVDRLRRRIAEDGRSASAISRAAGYGQDFIRDFLAGRKRKMSTEALGAIARELGVTIAWLQGGDEAMPEIAPPRAAERAARAARGGGDQIPIFGTAAGSAGGALHISPDTIGWVSCPPGIANLRDTYALYVVGHSMEPRFRQGDIVFVSPHRPPRPGDDIVVQVREPDSAETQSWVKELVRDTPERVVTRQHNPADEIVFERDRIVEIHRILPINELVGI
jgi:phage repressor protein C with HTH and peptisase S24 domain